MSRGSKKPCPGCGEVKPWRKSTEVCYDCKQLLNKARWMEEQLSRMDDDEIIVAFGQRAHWNEYIHARGGDSDHLRRIFQRLAESAGKPSIVYRPEFNLLGKIDGAGATYAVVRRSLAEAIRDLRSAVASALKSEYRKGKRDGQNLLMQLHSGELSIKDFEKEIK